MEIIQNNNIKNLQKSASLEINSLLKKEQNKNILLLLSGGSAFSVLFGIPESYLGENITVGMLDERFSKDPFINNFLQLKKLDFYQKAKNKNVYFIESIPKGEESYIDFAKRIENIWKNWKENNKDGIIIITEGIGTDGHTAGVLPYPEDKDKFEKLFLDDNVWVRVYDAGSKNKYPIRITATLSFLKNEVSKTFVYLVGEEKKNIYKIIIKEDGELNKIPAKIIKEMKDVKIFTNLNIK